MTMHAMSKKKIQHVLDSTSYCILLHKCIFDTWDSNQWNNFWSNISNFCQYWTHDIICCRCCLKFETKSSMMSMSTFKVGEDTNEAILIFLVYCLTQTSLNSLFIKQNCNFPHRVLKTLKIYSSCFPIEILLTVCKLILMSWIRLNLIKVKPKFPNLYLITLFST